MSEPKKELKTNFVGRSTFKGEGANSVGSSEASSKYFGVERNNKVLKRFKLLLRSGQQVSIPYAFIPIIILDEKGHIKIKTNEWTVIIAGRGLKSLEEHLSNDQVRWIKESASGIDGNEDRSFVSSISIDGDLDIY